MHRPKPSRRHSHTHLALNVDVLILNSLCTLDRVENNKNLHNEENKKTIERSDSMLIVGYYLARCGKPASNKKWSPPAALGAKSWKEAYNFFYEAVGDDRTPLQFRNSIRNTRDTFDILLDNDGVGWKDKDGHQPKLSARLEQVHEHWKNRSDKELETFVGGLRIGPLSGDLDDPTSPEARTEGGEKVFISKRRERDPKLREQALALHGYDCMSCGFNFEAFYGEIGKGFIEVHHVVPLADAKERRTDPENDLVVLCANCHRMVHRQKGICLSLNEIRSHITLAN